MHIQVNGAAIYCYTGGKAFDAAKPTVVFIHGVLNDHSVWALQSRYMANHGWNVLAVDLPGHGRSGGEAPASVEDAAAFIAALLDAAGLRHVSLAGVSRPQRVDELEDRAQRPGRQQKIQDLGSPNFHNQNQ